MTLRRAYVPRAANDGDYLICPICLVVYERETELKHGLELWTRSKEVVLVQGPADEPEPNWELVPNEQA